MPCPLLITWCKTDSERLDFYLEVGHKKKKVWEIHLFFLVQFCLSVRSVAVLVKQDIEERLVFYWHRPIIKNILPRSTPTSDPCRTSYNM